VPCKWRSSMKSRAWLQRFDDETGVPETIFCVEQWELNGSKNNCTAEVIVHYRQKCVFSSLVISSYLSFTTVRWQKNRFQQLWMYKNFKHRKPPCIPCLRETHINLQWNNIFPSLSFFCFFHSGYVVKPPPPSPAVYGAPPFTGHHIYFLSAKPFAAAMLAAK